MKKMFKLIIVVMACTIAFCNLSCYAIGEDISYNMIQVEERNDFQQPSEISPWGAMGLSSKVYKICYGDCGYIVLEESGELTGDLCTGDFCAAENDDEGGIIVYYHTNYEYARYSDEFNEIEFVRVD